jgi:bifunctional non-homologous end joining protein LigD
MPGGFLNQGGTGSPGAVGRNPQTRPAVSAVSQSVENSTRLLGVASTAAPTILSFTGTGGLTSTGTATATHAQRVAPSAGLTLDGGAVAAHRLDHVASGGLVTSGAAATQTRPSRFTASGGLTASGTAPITHTAHAPGTGGLVSSGAATATHQQNHIASGGVATGGAGAAVKRQTVTAAGGGVMSGASLAARLQRVTATGGVVSAGTATTTQVHVVAASGGAVFGGVADVQTRPVRYVGVGGASVGGSATTITRRDAIAAGGLAVAGAADVQHTSIHIPAAGLVVGGSATTTRGLAALGAGGLVTDGAAVVETRPTRDAYAGTGGTALAGAAVATLHITRTYDALGGLSTGGAATATSFDASAPIPAPAPIVPIGPGAGDRSIRRAQIKELQRERQRIRDLRSEHGEDITPEVTRAIVVRAHVAEGGFTVAGRAIVEIVHAAAVVAEIVAAVDAPLGIVTLTDAISDVTRYYADIWPALAEHLADRPVAIKRYIQSGAVYERDGWPDMPDTIARVAVPRRKGGPDHLTPLFNDRADLGWVLAHVGDVELHTYSKRASHDRPDWLVFDLDPGEGCDMVDCAHAAIVIRDALALHDLSAVVKTSGSKGLHVLVPLDGPTFADVRAFARPFAKLIATEHPELTHQIPRSVRRGKVFIDWTGNGPRRSLAAPYSWRKTSGHDDVSTPLSWAEVEHMSSPVRFSLDAVRARVERGDPWAGVPRGTRLLNLAVALSDDAELVAEDGAFAA